MVTKVSRPHDRVSTTDPNDPEAIPAFETAAGLPKRTKPLKPVYVNKTALENFNANVDPAVAKYQLEAVNVAALFAKRAIRPDEIAALRRRMFEVVASGLEDVSKVIAGTKKWDSVQVRLFSILTERVMPKLSTITVEDTTSKALEDLSIEELETIALGKRNHEAVDAVMKQGQELESAEVKKESIAASRKLKGSLIQIASIDQAEKAYKAKRSAPAKSSRVTLKKQSKSATRTRPPT